MAHSELDTMDATNDLITADSTILEQGESCVNITDMPKESIVMVNSGALIEQGGGSNQADQPEENTKTEIHLSRRQGAALKRNQMDQHDEKTKSEKPLSRRKKAAREMLNSRNYEVIKKNAVQYSREEMVGLRFVDIEEQKKKWIEVYCGLEPAVLEEYNGLAKSDKHYQKHGTSSFNFDPRTQFQKSASTGDTTVFSINDEMPCLNVEEDYDEDDETDEDYSGLLKPAFLVTGEPDFDSGPPQDGLEYLRRVRWEAARFPKVAKAQEVKKIKEQSFYMPKIPDIMKCSENLLPLKEWEESFLANFSELREAIAALDPENACGKSSLEMHTRNNLLVDHMLELEETTDARSNAGEDDFCQSEISGAEVGSLHSPKSCSNRDDLPPTLSKLLKTSPTTRVAMLKRRIAWIQKVSMISHDEGLWLFSLCATVDAPLDGDATAAIRSLLRKCASLRASKSEVDDEVVILNILVAITGLYFGQQEK